MAGAVSDSAAVEFEEDTVSADLLKPNPKISRRKDVKKGISVNTIMCRVESHPTDSLSCCFDLRQSNKIKFSGPNVQSYNLCMLKSSND